MANITPRQAAAFAIGAGVGVGGVALSRYLTGGSPPLPASTGIQSLSFPSDLGSQAHFMMFQFTEYKFATSGATFSTQGSIALPIPNNLKDNTSVNYETPSLTDIAFNAVGKGIGTAASILSSRAQKAGEVAQQSALGALGSGIADVVKSSAPALSAISGIQINPYQTVLFKHPNFKTHSFSWKLIPRDQAESVSLKNMITTFKKNMLPSRLINGSNFLFRYPNIVKPVLFPSEEYLYSFKPCVIKSFNANYASAGVPAFYKNPSSAPVAVDISIELMEMEYWMAEDFGAINTSTINGRTAINGQIGFQGNVPGNAPT